MANPANQKMSVLKLVIKEAKKMSISLYAVCLVRPSTKSTVYSGFATNQHNTDHFNQVTELAKITHEGWIVKGMHKLPDDYDMGAGFLIGEDCNDHYAQAVEAMKEAYPR